MTNQDYRIKIYDLIGVMSRNLLANSSMVGQNVNTFTSDATLFLYVMSYNDTIASSLARSTKPQSFDAFEDHEVSFPKGPVHQGYKKAIEDLNLLYDEYVKEEGEDFEENSH